MSAWQSADRRADRDDRSPMRALCRRDFQHYRQCRVLQGVDSVRRERIRGPRTDREARSQLLCADQLCARHSREDSRDRHLGPSLRSLRARYIFDRRQLDLVSSLDRLYERPNQSQSGDGDERRRVRRRNLSAHQLDRHQRHAMHLCGYRRHERAAQERRSVRSQDVPLPSNLIAARTVTEGRYAAERAPDRRRLATRALATTVAPKNHEAR